MDTAHLPLDLLSIEKLREQELEEACVIQNVMTPAHPLRHAGVTISHEFQPVTEVGGNYLDYFKLSDEIIGSGMEPKRVLSLLNQRLLL